MTTVYACRDADRSALSDRAWTHESYLDGENGAESAADEYIETHYSSHQYYECTPPFRIAVRKVNKHCELCDGEGLTADRYEDPDPSWEPPGRFVEGGAPCPNCPETIYMVNVEPTVRAFSEGVERFDHPEPPRRCLECGQRYDAGGDHSGIRDADGRYVRPWRYACTPTPTPEEHDVDRNPDPGA